MATLTQKAGILWGRVATGIRHKVYPAAAPDGEAAGFLPNFCSGPMVINVVVIAQMMALVITLVARRISVNIFQDLLIVSLFVQWIALSEAGTLCALRSWINRLPRAPAIAVTYGLLLLVTVVVTEMAVWLLYATGKIQTPRPDWYFYFHVQNFSISIVVNALALRYLLGVHQLQQRTLSEERARMQALKSRIRPHFVFNSLNIIASLTRSSPAKAEHAIEDMADLFRMMLSETENLVPILNEVNIAHKYIALEQLRLDNRLNVEWDIGKFPRKAIIPVLTLQPLLENAIRHGIEPNPEGGTIYVRLWEENDSIYIKVTNPVPVRKPRSGTAAEGQDLAELRGRLQLHYGDAATLTRTSKNGEFEVFVILPVRGENP
jgi:two-component system sensor histidine kinase AlgZ